MKWWQFIKIRIGVWLVIAALGVPTTLAALAGEWQTAGTIAALLAVVSHKLIDSEEKGG